MVGLRPVNIQPVYIKPSLSRRDLNMAYDQCLQQVRQICRTSASPLEGLHIETVVGIATRLAGRMRADIEVVRLGALLHDIGSIKFHDRSPNHAITGAVEARKMMKEFDLPEPFVSEVCACVRDHIPNRQPARLEGKIVRAADSMETLENFFELIFAFCSFKARSGKVLDPQMGIREGHAWIREKLSYAEGKISPLPGAMEGIRSQYEACSLILKETEPYLSDLSADASPDIMIRSFFKQIFFLCWEEAQRGGGFDEVRGLREGYRRSEAELSQAWKELGPQQKEELKDIYAVIQMVLESTGRNLQEHFRAYK
jgi:putative nucleotidyltransferase with HDIG domain